MKILFCSPNPLTKEQGAAKVLVELAEEMEAQGWKCDLVGPTDVCPDLDTIPKIHARYAWELRFYLQKHAADYDVVDYDHTFLPFARGDFSPLPLFVARSVLLTHHLEVITIPSRAVSWKANLGRVLKEPRQRHQRQRFIEMVTQTTRQADLINVSNDDDKRELIRRGIAAEKIAVIPFGISRSRRLLFNAVSSESPPQPRVAFVGTFDARKGACEFPSIVEAVVAAVPDVRFKLLGSGGAEAGHKRVLDAFPPPLRANLEVVPSFQADELPQLLADCSMGIFPSYIEGFGFGVLEMLAAALPVIAYNAPGPPMMLPPKYLVSRGDALSLSRKVTALLQDPAELSNARRWARQRSQGFCWRDIAQATGRAYLKAKAGRSILTSEALPSVYASTSNRRHS